MPPLLIVGVALVIFGALVLLRFPGVTGGTVSFAGAKVSSTGAGLPLIVLGVAAIALATPSVADRVNLPWSGASGTAGPTTASSATCFSDVAPDRVTRMEAGASDQELLGPQQTKNDPFAVVLTSNGDPIGQVHVRLFTENELFKVDVVDASCGGVSNIRNVGRGGDPRTLQNWDAVGMTLASGDYNLELGYDGGAVSANFRQVVQ